MRLPAPEALAGEGLVHQAKQRCPVPEEADKGAPQRLADDEGAGAVDRIDDPAIVGLGPARAELLADDAVRRVGLGDRLSDGGFGGDVGGSDRVEQGAAFMVNGEARPEMRQYDRTSTVGERVGGGEEGGEIGGAGHGVP